MAFEIPLFTPAGFVALDDMRTTGQFRFVKLTAENTVDVCTVAGEQAVGVLQNSPNLGQEAAVMVHGVSKVVAGEALSVNDLVGTDNQGRAQKVEETGTGADVGSWALGRVLTPAGAAGEVISVALATPVGFRVTA